MVTPSPFLPPLPSITPPPSSQLLLQRLIQSSNFSEMLVLQKILQFQALGEFRELLHFHLRTWHGQVLGGRKLGVSCLVRLAVLGVR
jgi:hypothetical protein